MLHKGNIKISNGLKLFYLSQKSVIAAIFFSLFVIFAVIPFLNYSAYKELGMNDMLKDALINTARRLIPLCAVVPPVMLLRLFLESDCKELMYIYLFGKRLALTFSSAVSVFLLTAVLFISYGRHFNGFFAEFLKTACICCLLYGVSYLLMSVLRSTAIVLLAIMTYELFVITSNSVLPINYVLYPDKTVFYWLCLLAMGVFFAVIGEAAIKHRESL